MNIITTIQSCSYSSRTPKDLAYIQYYGEARGDKDGSPIPFFGLRRFVVDFLSEPITDQIIEEAELLACSDFDRDMWEHIVDNHYGYLPIKITGIKEGTLAMPGEPMWTVESIDPKCVSLPSMIDKLLVSYIWFESTIAQKLHFLREDLSLLCKKNGLSSDIVSYLAGGSTMFGDAKSTAVANSMIHLYFPQSVDTDVAIYLSEYFNYQTSACNNRVLDHSSIITWEDEDACFKGMLEQYSDDWFAMPTDTFDYVAFFEEIIPRHKEVILGRNKPISIVVDCSDYSEAFEFALSSLEKTFGVAELEGKKLLDAPITLVQLEELTTEQIRDELEKYLDRGWHPSTFFFHISDQFIQSNLSRGVNGFIQKACAAVYENGEQREICKECKQDSGKKTKKGHQSIRELHKYYDYGVVFLESVGKIRIRLIK